MWVSVATVFLEVISWVHPSVGVCLWNCLGTSMFVDVPLVPPEKIPRALLTSPGDPMPVGLTIEMFQLMSSWVKADVSTQNVHFWP